MAFYHFLVLGEEKRQYYLAQMLKEGHEVMEAMSYQPGYHDAILLPV